MKEKLKGMWEKVKSFFASMNKKLKIAIGAIAALAVAAIVIVIVYRNVNKPYTVLFSDLSSEDMASVLGFMSDNNITEYQVEGSDTILVPEDQESRLRAQLIQQGYPSSGFAYDTYWDHIGTLSSESDRIQTVLYELQDRLGATIKLMDGVQEAVVNISVGEDHRYILDSEDIIEASAHVMVVMKNGWEMDRSLAQSIINCVSHATQGLQFENVSVTDSTGTTYSGDDATDPGLEDSASAQLKISLEEKTNQGVCDRVSEVLLPMFGSGNFSVSAASTVDVSRIYEESTTYNAPEDTSWNELGGHGLIGSYVWDNTIVAGGDETAGGVVGTGTNADISEYAAGEATLDGTEQEVGTQGSTEYDNDEFKTQSETPGGRITDVTVAVSVNSRTMEPVDVTALTTLVARAAGISSDVEADKVSILYYPFYEEPTVPVVPSTEVLPDWAIYALIVGLALFILLLGIVIALSNSVRKRREKLIAEKRAEMEAAAAAEAARLAEEEERERAAILAAAEAMRAGEGEGTPEGGADIMDIHTEKSMELRKSVREFTEKNPEIAAQMIRNWLKEGSADRG